MKITIEGNTIDVVPASPASEVVKALIGATASAITCNFADGVSKEEAAAQFGTLLENRILSGVSAEEAEA